MRTRLIACLGLVAASVIGLASCKPATSAPNPPFAVSMSNEVLFVQLAAQDRLPSPGEEGIFYLVVRNKGPEPWYGRYCLELLDDERPLAVLGQDALELEVGEQLTQELNVQWPDDLPDGIYGLALVLPNTFWVAGNVSIGAKAEDPIDSWPEPSCW